MGILKNIGLGATCIAVVAVVVALCFPHYATVGITVAALFTILALACCAIERHRRNSSPKYRRSNGRVVYSEGDIALACRYVGHIAEVMDSGLFSIPECGLGNGAMIKRTESGVELTENGRPIFSVDTLPLEGDSSGSVVSITIISAEERHCAAMDILITGGRSFPTEP